MTKQRLRQARMNRQAKVGSKVDQDRLPLLAPRSQVLGWAVSEAAETSDRFEFAGLPFISARGGPQAFCARRSAVNRRSSARQ